MSINNNRFHQHVLPGLDPIDSTALNAAKLAYEQERLRFLRDQEMYAAQRENREQANHSARLARENAAFTDRQHYDALRAQTDARRAQLDEQYKQEQLNFMQARARMQHQSDLVNQLSSLMKTFGQLWYWEEQVQVQKVDVAMRNYQGMQRLRLQELNDSAMQQINFLKFRETNRHNLAMEGEGGRHNRQMEVQSWEIQIYKFREECRSNHVREFTHAWQAYYQFLETQRANNMRGQNDANKNAEQVRHNARMEAQQAQFNATRLGQSRGGFRSIVTAVAKFFLALFVFFCLFCAYVFTHWTGQSQSDDGAWIVVFVVIFLLIISAIALKIGKALYRANCEKTNQQQVAQWQGYLGSVPPSLQVQQGVPPWMFQQYQQNQVNMPPNGMWNGGQPPYPPTF